MIDWRAFGEQVMVARRRRNMRQAHVALAIGVSRAYVSMLENGAYNAPNYATVERLCALLDLELPRGKDVDNDTNHDAAL